MRRTFDADSVDKAVQRNPDAINFNAEEWCSNTDNIALTNDKDDFALFENEYPGAYTGHYFFNSRGKEAVKAAEEFLLEAFTNYPIEVIRGLTPADKLGAKWLSRRLGFTSYGTVETIVGDCELFILTKDEFNNE